MTDLHTHILPGMDDGPKTLPDAMALVERAALQGVDHIALTRHFHCDTESVAAFLERREIAFSALRELVSAEKLGLLLTTPATVWKGSKQEGTMTPAEIEAWLADEKPTQQYYSDRYACAYLTRKEGTATIAAWYLNGEAAAQRAQLCGLFGVDQVCFSDLDAVSAGVLAGLEK